MSRETSEWLNTQTLIGMTEQRGKAWHYRAEDQGSEPNHYPGYIPVGDVRRRLFGWRAEAVAPHYPVPFGTTPETPADPANPGYRLVEVPGSPLPMIADLSRRIVYRSDTGRPLGVFSSKYPVMQYGEMLLDGLAALVTPDGLAVSDDSLGIGSAGLLKGGAVAWVQIERPETVATPEGVDFRTSILASASMDGSLPLSYSAVNQVVVCDNTHAWALDEAERSGRVWKLRRRSALSQLAFKDAREALQMVVQAEDGFAADIAKLCDLSVNTTQFRQLLDDFAPLPEEEASKSARTRVQNKRDQLELLWTSDERVKPWTGTGFGWLQTVNTWQHHIRPAQGNRAGRNTTNAVTGKTADADALTLERMFQVLTPAR
ncbi:DUF932 domain-containing protein [Nocardia uniformis]|uniref:DUF932 domain-containing protein n=2 Tax=Nocardia uniformis TaxID=53432 RepID=A0A849CBR3_9NOCA|nr:DUF932 domain-containing protein [Nocardia uniformis]